jgi:glycosyltransferase involved in cell wall biosynthesis
LPFLSIIIPVFNVENYIDECLQSIINQDFNDYEVILVDNGSTDQSSKICDTYAEKYKYIKVIHLNENLLPAGARNLGLNEAVGKYIHFCDSDDYYVDGSFSSIAKLLENSSATVLIGKFICTPEKGAFVSHDVSLDEEIINNGDANIIANYLVGLPNLLCTPWRFIVKRELLLSNNLKFTEGYHSEDEEWFPKIVCCANSFVLHNEPFYYYRPRATGSVTSSKTFLNSKSHLVVAMNLLKFLKERQYTDGREVLIYNRVTLMMALFTTRCDTFNNEQLKEIAAIIDDNLDVLSIFNRIFQQNSLFSFVTNYGSYNGVCLYREFVIDKTLNLVDGKMEKDIYIFPTGYNGEGTARILLKKGYSVKGFLDNSDYKNGSEKYGIPVCLPKILEKMSHEKLKDIFVIISTQRVTVAEIIMNQLRDIGLDDTQFVSRIY